MRPSNPCSMSSHLSHEVLSVLCTQGQLSKYNVTINNNPGNTFLYIGDSITANTGDPPRDGNYL